MVIRLAMGGKRFSRYASHHLCIILVSLLIQATRSLPKADNEKCPVSSAGQFRIDCHPEQESASESECLKRGCCWQQQQQPSLETVDNQPYCFFPVNFNCYTIELVSRIEADKHLDENLNSARSKNQQQQQQQQQQPKHQLTWLLNRRADCKPSGFHDDAKQLKLELNVYGNSIINIKISEPAELRFEPKLPEIRLPKPRDRVYIPGNSNTYSKNNNIIQAAVANNSDHLSYRRRLMIGKLRVEFGFGSSVDDDVDVGADKTTATTGQGSSTLRVIHHISNTILFETDLSKLIFSRQFIQLPTYLPSALIYGLGQHMGISLLKSSSKSYAKPYTMFNYGHPPQTDGRTAYSSYPFYINIASLPGNDSMDLESEMTKQSSTSLFERKRKLMATGALMLNSNAMDVLLHSSINDGQRAGITWRLVGGIVNLFFFVGPTPHDVINQYQSLVGAPTLPPAWALGYHQSRLNYRDLIRIKEAWARTRSAGIPMESIWTDLDFLWHGTSYTLNNPELNDLVKTLQNEFGMHYVPIVDPAISVREEYASYEALKLATSMNLFAYYPDGIGESSTAIVTTWPESGQSGLLDFTHAEIVPYLTRILKEYKEKLNFDGIWLDMNEPEVFANKANEKGQVCAFDEEPKYLPGNRKLYERTMCMSAEFQAGKHYDLHNIYAFYQSKAHYEALRALNSSRRPLVISRSQFAGQGKYSGTWLGDLTSLFDHMKWSVLGTIESNWFGQPLVGADICGFFGHTTNELCARWFSLGAFYPFARNHNDGFTKDQDPGALNEDVQRTARVAMMRRYSMLPYLYSLFYENHLNGEPVISSILFRFFEQFHTRISSTDDLPQIDDQFVWGRSLMIAPVLDAGVEERSVFLTQGRWYDISIGLQGTNTEEGQYDALKSNWPSPTGEMLENNLSLRERLDHLRRPIDCKIHTGCLLANQYTPLGVTNLYLRGGSIIPTFRRVSHEDSIGKIWTGASFFLEVALDASGSAYGSLFWDNGESDPSNNLYNRASFYAADDRLVITMLENRFEETLSFNGFVVYGAKLEHQIQEDTIYKGSKLVYSLDKEREVLSCEFKSLTGDRDRPISVKRFDSISIKWS